MIAFRNERDSLGELEIPQDAYWGVHTARAKQNFSITGQTVARVPELIAALANVKWAAAVTNRSLGLLDDKKAAAIAGACAEIVGGGLHDQFVIDVIQGGAGTSTNMNANEVIANRALEILGYPKGDYSVLSPLDDVNRSQSTNDVYPTAVKLALVAAINSYVLELGQLRSAFEDKAVEFAEVVKMGRTQLQDAVPMTLGREFGGFAVTLGEDIERLLEVVPLLCEVNLGATAIGTGITAEPGYAEAVCRTLAELTGLPIRLAPDLVEATSDVGVFMQASAMLKRSAVKLSKICNDLRLLSSGPQLGLGEIRLPARQAGSSIMPGKVNPVIPEVVSQIAYVVIGTDATVTAAAEAGQLQLNAFEPVMAHSLFQGFDWMERACVTLRINCIVGIEANEEKLRRDVAGSVGVITALIPHIGYARAAQIAKAALADGRTVGELVLESGLVGQEALNELLAPRVLAGLVQAAEGPALESEFKVTQ